jgi:hypothetical protein
MPLEATTFKENFSIHSDIFKNMSISSRKSYFSSKKNLKKYNFDPKFIYTFDFHQHVLKVDIFKLDLGLMQYDIFNVLGMSTYIFVSLCMFMFMYIIFIHIH